MSDFSTGTIRSARRPHACEACPDPIAAGERHAVWSGRYDDRFCRVRLHGVCLAVCRMWLRLTGGDWEDRPETVREMLEDLTDSLLPPAGLDAALSAEADEPPSDAELARVRRFWPESEEQR